MRSYNKVLTVSSVSCLIVLILGFAGFSGILQFVVKDQTALRKRNMIRKFYLKLPIPLDFRVYFFNITNPDEVKAGQMPIVKEIGPYCYDSYKEKIEVQDNEGEDSLSYTPYETYFYNQERSGALTVDDYVTVLHPLIVGMVNTVAKVAPPMLPVVNNALKSMFNDPQNIYFTIKVRDILFDGMTINCKSKDFAAAAVCSQIKSQVPGLVEPEKNVFKFSIFGPRNGTLPTRFKVLRGTKKSEELGRVVEYNHEKEINIWSSKQCNRFHGTDGWIFPPMIKKEEGLWIYVADACRSMQLTYVEDMTVHGVTVEKYYADLGDMSSNPAEKCYCPTPRTCLPKGIMDLSKCIGVPIYLSLPHFLRADEQVQKTIQGMNPVTEKHINRALMQPLLAVPLEAHRRIQFNFPIQPNKKISFMQTLPQAIHPVFWIEEGVILEGTLLTMVKGIFVSLKVFNIVKYCLLAGCLGGMGYGGYLHYKEKTSGKVIPLDKASSATSRKSEHSIKSKLKSALREATSGFARSAKKEVGSGFIKAARNEVGSGFIKSARKEVGSGFTNNARKGASAANRSGGVKSILKNGSSSVRKGNLETRNGGKLEEIKTVSNEVESFFN